MLHVIILFTWFFGGLHSPFFEYSLHSGKPKKDFQANLPARIVKGAQGQYHLTAAKGKAIGPDIKFMPEFQAFGWFTSKDRVEWEVDIQKAGDYQVDIIYSVDNAEAGKEFILSSPTSQLIGKVLPSGSWETYRTLKGGKIHLAAGLQKIEFKSKTQFKAGGAILDLREIVLR
ncbi:carbohydrate-binding protein [Aquirufa aurantiipilula]|uniref:carbohydrate-binding protein n=1 Tax=Aquirufa aurantiipilula TaxID=2696561 RepID=UPI001CAA80EB|nr:carbohydrate-binding protein [Aquirufa aurantiipilula]MBZ1325712.1 carbohydrate-binding protein [Aquirufa aurantiipilula]